MRLELMRRTDLALRAMLALDAHGGRMTSTELAEEICGTRPFVSQVMTPLVKQGWVASVPGPRGGYELRVALDDVSILELVEAVEGPTDTGKCVLTGVPCPPGEPCALHDAWTRARQALLDELARTPLSAVGEIPGCE